MPDTSIGEQAIPQLVPQGPQPRVEIHRGRDHDRMGREAPGEKQTHGYQELEPVQVVARLQ